MKTNSLPSSRGRSSRIATAGALKGTFSLGLFHAAGRNLPCPGGEIDFAPPRSDCFAAAGCGQHREFQRPSGDALDLGQLGHESRDLGKRDGGMMPHGTDPIGAGEQMFHAAFPSCRILAHALAEHLGEIEDRLDPAAQPAAVSGFVFQMDFRTSSTWSTAISETGTEPIVG
jgi:hypothetical protein